MKISCRNNGNLTVEQFIKEHNHYLSSPNKTHLYKCHRNISSSVAIQIEMTSDVGIPPKASHDLMVKQVGGRENLGFIPEDYKNYLRSKRTRNMRVGDTGGVLEFLQKMQFDDPNFFYAIQVDEDDLITNIFWCDAKMRADYGNFGDVVCFDTTYRKNNEGRPIALFVGVNHHKQSIIFGAALLYDETSLIFEWLFDTFTKAMYEKKPITILTDQDAAMAKALASRWPKTHHRLCIWHIYQNVAIHLSRVFSQFKEFTKDFASCIYDFDEEEDFITAWNIMLTNLDPKACTNLRYKELSGLYVQLVTKAAEREDTYKVVKDGLLSMFKMVDERLQVNKPTTQDSIEKEIEIGEGNALGVKGIKTKKKTVSGKRLKGGLDKISKKRKAARRTNQTSTVVKDVEEHYESISSMPSPTNYSCVEGLSMTETQFPPLLSTQLSQVHSDNDYFQTSNREGWCFNGVNVATMECTSTKEHHKE
ncbi:protein FAR1-RELATED SEQUENCE 5-like [Zingiber officinale]|uniref:protein FAR1-RELATED SEQUENCE 5-like n=1 Tax=Zingiber officinale TaxID=94328 RepID=UPI001C4B48DE|nr:protein FAR1-RELATED SEQUENCE 5-like [Zingiber officinale]